ncbi:MAG: hypothetical protein ABF535_09740 [Acetobacter sp.]
MSEHQLVSVVRRYLPSQKTLNRAKSAATDRLHICGNCRGHASLSDYVLINFLAYLTQNEFNALVSFVYNPGRGWPGVRAAINSGDKRKAAMIIEEQVRSKGKVLRGLVRRRHDEAMLLLKGRY